MQFLFPVMTPEVIFGECPLSKCPQSLFRERRKTFWKSTFENLWEHKNVRPTTVSQKGPSNISNTSQIWMPIKKWRVRPCMCDSNLDFSPRYLLMGYYTFLRHECFPCSYCRGSDFLFLRTCPVSSWCLASFLHLQHTREDGSIAESFCLYLENPRKKYALGVHWSSKNMTNNWRYNWDKSITNVWYPALPGVKSAW